MQHLKKIYNDTIGDCVCLHHHIPINHDVRHIPPRSHPTEASDAGMGPDFQVVTKRKSNFVDPEKNCICLWSFTFTGLA